MKIFFLNEKISEVIKKGAVVSYDACGSAHCSGETPDLEHLALGHPLIVVEPPHPCPRSEPGQR